MKIKIALDFQYPRVEEFLAGEQEYIEIDIAGCDNLECVINKVFCELGRPKTGKDWTLVWVNPFGSYVTIKNIKQLYEGKIYEVWAWSN